MDRFTGLTGHLGHEEDQMLPVIQAVIAQEQWAHFGQIHTQWIDGDASRILPWLLDGASEQVITTILAPLPQPTCRAYQASGDPPTRP